jgi:hypothetical protein
MVCYALNGLRNFSKLASHFQPLRETSFSPMAARAISASGTFGPEFYIASSPKVPRPDLTSDGQPCLFQTSDLWTQLPAAALLTGRREALHQNNTICEYGFRARGWQPRRNDAPGSLNRSRTTDMDCTLNRQSSAGSAASPSRLSRAWTQARSAPSRRSWRYSGRSPSPGRCRPCCARW